MQSGKSYKRRTDALGKELPIHPQVYRILFSLSTVKPFCLRPLQEKMGSLSIGSVWPEHVFWKSLFPCRRCGGGRKSNLVSSSSSFPPCHTIKSHGWEEMHCSFPSRSVVLLDGIIRPRCQAGRQEASSISIWPSGSQSGPQFPAWAVSRCFSYFSL